MDDMPDKQAQFEALVRSYSTDIYRMAVWLCRDPALADDLVQETFLRAWKAIDSLRDDKAAKRWLITILRREFARLFERKVPKFVDAEDVVLPDDRAPAPDDRAEARLLRKAIGELEVPRAAGSASARRFFLSGDSGRAGHYAQRRDDTTVSRPPAAQGPAGGGGRECQSE